MLAVDDGGGDELPLLTSRGAHFVGANRPAGSAGGGARRLHEPLSVPLFLVSGGCTLFVLGCAALRLSGFYLRDVFSVTAWMFGALGQLCLFAIVFALVAAVLDAYGIDYVALLGLDHSTSDGPNGALR
jgi:hypothetical protein